MEIELIKDYYGFNDELKNTEMTPKNPKKPKKTPKNPKMTQFLN